MNRQVERFILTVIFSLLAGSVLLLTVGKSTAFAHEKNQHKTEAPPAKPKDQARQDRLTQVNESYVRDVKPIFSKKCMDCHSDQTRFPWYSSIPGAKQLIRRDIKEAKEHMDMSRDFPFAGHGEPVEDLNAIQETVVNDSMPPFRYKIMHWGSGLTEAEKKTVRDWIEKGLKILSQEAGESEPKNDGK